ncbi:hypothetical protein N665_0264s0004 [Sinapis alba]|nr:hypothetical protein N665_0264s0004 [Sinapis alba]
MREFKEKNKVDKVEVLCTANTERSSNVTVGLNLNDTMENLMKSVDRDECEISPSTLYAIIACVLEGILFINGSPQNTFVPGLIDLSIKNNVLVGVDDFKSGQTKMNSAVVDFLPTSILSYNHLGNNDGINLSAPQTFRSKEISKSNVVDDMVASNDSKRAMDEYTSEIFMGGKNTIVVHNTCEDSLLAAPVIWDLVLRDQRAFTLNLCRVLSNLYL